VGDLPVPPTAVRSAPTSQRATSLRQQEIQHGFVEFVRLLQEGEVSRAVRSRAR
jgi:hypothetical protein